MTNLERAIKKLLKYHSWKLERLSPKTYYKDILFVLGRPNQVLRKDEVLTIINHRKTPCFRAMIGRGRFFYATNPLQAFKFAEEDFIHKQKLLKANGKNEDCSV